MRNMRGGRLATAFGDVLLLLLGSALYAVGFWMFIEPTGLILGGATGLATLMEALVGIPVGIGVILLNLPLLLFAVRAEGGKMLLRTLVGLCFSAMLLDALAFLPPVSVEPFGAAVLGGGATGVGIAFLLLRGYTTGGSDLAGSLLHRLFPAVSIGKWILLLDSAIVFLAFFWHQSVEALVFSIVLNVAFALFFECFVGGSRRGRLAIVVTNRHAEIERGITEQLGRGVTELLGIGAYEGAARRVLMCAVTGRELYFLEKIVKEGDRDAFLIVTDTHHIVGRGFDARES